VYFLFFLNFDFIGIFLNLFILFDNNSGEELPLSILLLLSFEFELFFSLIKFLIIFLISFLLFFLIILLLFSLFELFSSFIKFSFVLMLSLFKMFFEDSSQISLEL
jgi:hypothetical protein